MKLIYRGVGSYSHKADKPTTNMHTTNALYFTPTKATRTRGYAKRGVLVCHSYMYAIK